MARSDCTLTELDAQGVNQATIPPAKKPAAAKTGAAKAKGKAKAAPKASATKGKLNIRIADVASEAVGNILMPLCGVMDQPLVSLAEAVRDVVASDPDLAHLNQSAAHALNKAEYSIEMQGPDKNGLTAGEQRAVDVCGANCYDCAGVFADEFAALNLYSQEHESTSFYTILNHTMRNADRTKSKAFFKYLKLFFTAGAGVLFVLFIGR